MADKIEKTTEEKGTGTLLLGSGIGAYGATNFALSGFICPACIIAAPALLGYGAYQRYKFNKNQRDAQKESSSQDHIPAKE
ncbi:MAG: hypothetical protein AAF988_07195 [Pseudomonadota bacterium]